MKREIESIIKNSNSYKYIYNKLLKKESIEAKNIIGSLKSLIFLLVTQELNRPAIMILPDREQSELVAEEINGLVDYESVMFFPGGEEEKDSPLIINPRRSGLQMKTLAAIVSGGVKHVVTSPEGIMLRVPPPEEIERGSIELYIGMECNMYDLIERLIDYGYTRESMVERPGEISTRGGILDIFPLTGEEPQRIEFFGNRIDSIRIFDIETQCSKKRGDKIVIVPSPISWKDREATIFSYFNKELILFIEDRDLVFTEIEKIENRSDGDLIGLERIKKLIEDYQIISMNTIGRSRQAFDFGARPINKTSKRVDEIRRNLLEECEKYRNCFIAAEDEIQKERLKEFLNLEVDSIPGLTMSIYPITQGFVLPDADLAVYTIEDILGRRVVRRKRRGFKDAVPIRELSELKKGDFVVHIDYGIGQYQGLEKIRIRGSESECLSILYKDGDKLYVPVDKMERVQKYSGRQGVSPPLTKIGGGGWEKKKYRTKEFIKKIARELIEIYSAREVLPGHSFSKDTVWQSELEASFPYQETPDQIRTIEEVKKDMEKSRPMDRLVCGDVGFGKTEVALRAAFKAVNDGKQVAVLVPTTILAQQHYQTFKERLDRFPVIVEVLSRFKSKGEQKSIIERVKRGEIDIIIGTHRILSADIVFKDIGLVIIDEEHRFGVKHKEKLKKIRKTVDVLTLTATPIPRTLQLSLMDIRDMSIINTPPKDRLPIITEVVAFNEDIIRDAIEEEIDREGQIFFVHNHINSIDAVARMIKKIVPHLRLAIAHGRMKTDELERVMLDFIERKYDCLVATMIIGSGLDMPNVNTLIVNRADKLGLAQLYQLRGRIGRSDRRAYAYLLTPPIQSMTQDAIKRLRTIEEFTELGSGFQIALRDLEIRGSGNLLGIQQSGFIDAVGFDLYLRLIGEAIEELKRGEKEREMPSLEMSECGVDIDIDAFFPVSFVPDESIRVNLYRKLSSFKTEEQISSFTRELRDRFGKLPIEAENLLNVSELKILGTRMGFKRIIINGRKGEILFNQEWTERFSSEEQISEWLRSIIESSPVPVRFKQSKIFAVMFDIPEERDKLSFTRKLLQSWS